MMFKNWYIIVLHFDKRGQPHTEKLVVEKKFDIGSNLNLKHPLYKLLNKELFKH